MHPTAIFRLKYTYNFPYLFFILLGLGREPCQEGVGRTDHSFFSVDQAALNAAFRRAFAMWG